MQSPLLVNLLLLSCAMAPHLYADPVEFGLPGPFMPPSGEGTTGYPGDSMTVETAGEAMHYDLTGGPGNFGMYGVLGYAARDCRQPLDVPYNLIGARGGRGGDGGKGGRGGEGGNFEVTYQHLDDLKNITLINPGGVGGPGGTPAPGGTGCECEVPSWEVEGTEFHCTEGPEGEYGDIGPIGDQGPHGEIYLVKNDPDRLPEDAYVRKPLGDPTAWQALVVEDQWDKKTGAKELFHPDSNIGDTYYEYTHDQIKYYVTLDWRANASPSMFRGHLWRANLSIDGKLRAKVDRYDIRASSRLEGSGQHWRFVIDDISYQRDISAVSFDGTKFCGDELVLKLTEHSPRSVSTKPGHISFLAKQGQDIVYRFLSDLQESDLKIDGRKMTVDLSGYRIKPKYRRCGTPVWIHLTLRRSGSQTKNIGLIHIGQLRE